MHPARRILVSLLLPFIFPVFSLMQGPIAPPLPRPESLRSYENSSAGLRWQLQDILNAARGHDRSKLEALISQTEIPNFKEWFTKSFGSQKGEAWAGSYGSNRDGYEKYLEGELTNLAGEDGEFLIRRVNDDPAPARKMEANMIDALQRPVDIFFASWRQRNSPQGAPSSPIGYFVFLDGRFRLDSAISSSEIQVEASADSAVPQAASPSQTAAVPNKPLASAIGNGISRPGVGGIGYPSCVYCPDPTYTKLARKKHLEGMVVMQAVIQADGGVTDLQVVKSPNNELKQMALDGVSKWHMNPARRADGEAVPVIVPIEITFRLLK